MNSKLTRFIRGGRDHSALAALSAHDDGFAFQRWIVKFLYGNKESIHVDVEDRAGEGGLFDGSHGGRILAAVGDSKSS